MYGKRGLWEECGVVKGWGMKRDGGWGYSGMECPDVCVGCLKMYPL